MLRSLTQFLVVGFLPPDASHKSSVKVGEEQGLISALPSVNVPPKPHLPVRDRRSTRVLGVIPGQKEASAP